MDRDHFYVTLLSSASLQLYPSNTIAAFTSQLAKTIELDPSENWEVGLCEISYSPPNNVGTIIKPAIVIGDTNALVYCDLIEPQFIGTAMARYLRTFVMSTVYGVYTFKNVYYVPVEKRTFRDIRIEVLNLSGQRAAFEGSRTPLKVVLNFRRVAPTQS
jgi:hypothetical protein